MRGETETATAICDEGRATVTTMGELQRRQQWASYSDREASIGVWFGFAVLVQRLCIGIFFFFFVDKHSILLLVYFAFAP